MTEETKRLWIGQLLKSCCFKRHSCLCVFFGLDASPWASTPLSCLPHMFHSCNDAAHRSCPIGDSATVGLSLQNWMQPVWDWAVTAVSEGIVTLHARTHKIKSGCAGAHSCFGTVAKWTLGLGMPAWKHSIIFVQICEGSPASFPHESLLPCR